MIETEGCPNCGGRVERGGDAIRCTHCGSQLAFLPPPPGVPRQSPLHSPRVFLAPTLGCIGVYAAVFVVSSLILTSFGLRDRPAWASAVAAIAITAGVGTVGMLDLWFYEFSWRGFLAGLAAGVTYYLFVVFLYHPGMQRYPLVRIGFAIVSGSLGATAWWLVCHGSRLWVALAVGSTMALAHLYSGGLRRR